MHSIDWLARCRHPFPAPARPADVIDALAELWPGNAENGLVVVARGAGWAA